MVIVIAGLYPESFTRAPWENLTVAKILKEVKVDRRAAADRREGSDRRKTNKPVAVERRATERRKVPRRRQIDPTTCERDYSGDEIEFMQALDNYKRANGRMFPTCSEILEVIRGLGYIRVGTSAPVIESNPVPSDSQGEIAADIENDIETA